MKSIAEIDRNFQLPTGMPEGMRFYRVDGAPFTAYGLADNAEGLLCRLPVPLLKECNEGVQQLAYHLSGACIRFATDAARLGIAWQLRETGNMPHFAASGQSGMELFEESDAGSRTVHSVLPQMDGGHGCLKQQSSLVSLPGGLRHYALCLPLYNGVEQLRIGLEPGAQLLPGHRPRIAEPIVFYGSSITQGGCASKAGSSYCSILCRRLDAAQHNLGFSGSALGEPALARYIAGLRMSALVMDYDHNAPTVEHLQQTHAPFFGIIRKAQPGLPILMLSRPDPEVHPADSAKRLAVIRGTYECAVQAGDRHVYLVDGESLFGLQERDLCTVDGTHPTDIGFLRMADALEPVLRRALQAAGQPVC